MTDIRKNNPLFVGHGFGVDFLMSLMFFFGMSSLGIFLLCYIHVVRVPYTVQFSATIMVLVYCFLRRLRVGFFPMVIMHIAATCVYLLCVYTILQKTVEAEGNVIYLATLLFANIIYSLTQRVSRALSRVRNDGFLFALVLHVILFGLFVATGYHFRLPMITTNAIIMVTCYFIARQFNTFEDKYYHNIHSATQPVASVKKQNRMLVILVVGGIAFAVIALLFFPTEDLSKFLSSIVLAIARFFGRFFTETDPEADPIEQEFLESEPPEEADFHKTPLINALAAIGVIVISICIFIFLVTLLLEIIKKFKKIQPIEKTVENDAVTDIIESIDSKQRKKSSFRHDFGQGYEREIRKKYYQRVTRAIKDGLPIKASSSPHQIERIIKRSGDPSISELTSQYESVRYNKK